ncbi:MAG: hypothetical protein LBV02_03245 [Bacteroidales bacterium]|jgi:3-hydroxyacyl-[acyl-carrier-protein] dehydratase|nr:hypothetical protein [Bacteroidales bacterium]
MLSDFYNINDKHIESSTARYNISFNREHPIYRAHFPEHPITPGACLIQICKELTENMIGESLFLQTVKNVKFLKIIDPTEVVDVSVSLSVIKQECDYKVNVMILDVNEDIFSKMSLVFQSINL